MRVHAYSEALDEPMVLDEIPEPVPGPGELLIKVKAIGVNPVDLSIRWGLPNYVAHLEPPHLLGSEVSGEVAGWGENVANFEKGQRVFSYCPKRDAYAEYVAVDAGIVSPLPGDISFADGAAFSVAFQTAWHALVIQAKAGPGETVLVHGGAGGVGVASIQLAKAMGCRVFTTVSSKEKADFCRSFGADESINYREEDFAARCKELTDGRGVEVITEVAAYDNFDKDLDAIALRGRIVLIGMGTGKGPVTSFRVPAVMGKNAAILGITARNLGPVMPEIIRGLGWMWRAHNLRVPVAREMPLENANECHDILQSGKFLGKLVLVV
jgi:NADPH:quinone reductase-like Zn-dependent oxidoreductase